MTRVARSSSAPKIVRILRLYTILQSDGGNTKWLAQELGVSRRTIFRDLKIIRECGLTIEFDTERSRYYFSGPTTTYSVPFGFIVEDLACLLFAVSTSPAVSCAAVRKAVTRAKAYLYGCVSLDSRMQQRRISTQVLFKGQDLLNSSGQLAADVLVRALSHSVCVRITVQVHGNGKALHTKFSPYCLSISDDAWTVTGRSSQCRRTVHVDINHITTIEELDETFELPREFVRMWQERDANYPKNAPRY